MEQPIIEGRDGVTLTSTGLVAVREDAGFVDDVLAGRAADRERAFRLVMTLNHEAVHFFQCFTASFPYSFALSVLDVSSQLMASSRRGRLSSGHIEEFKRLFARRIAQFRSPHSGISTIDLLEAMAVTEGYRATVPDSRDNGTAFRQFLLECFPDPESVYRRVIDRVTAVFGVEAGYHLTPRLCYLSLNGDRPAENLTTFLTHLASDRKDSAHRLSATQILRLFGMEISSSILKLSEDALPDEAKHPIFAPYMRALAGIGSLQERYEFCAQPGNWMRTGGLPEIGRIVPPLVVCSGGFGRIMGLANDWSKEEAFLYMDSAAMIGACIVLLSGRKHHQTCRHTECPIHSSTLCHHWFSKPQAIPWTECAFPKRVEVQFGASAGQLAGAFGL